MCCTFTLKCGHFLVRTTRSALFRHIPEAVMDLPGSPLHLYLQYYGVEENVRYYNKVELCTGIWYVTVGRWIQANYRSWFEHTDAVSN